MHRSTKSPDPRCERTRAALQSALILLALRKPYDQIRVDEIVEASGIARSTFYEHYAGKDALLAASVDGAMCILADMPTEQPRAHASAMLFAHFWSNRALAQSLFQGKGLTVIRDHLVAHIERSLRRHAGQRLRLPPRLAARALADGIVSPLAAWLFGEASCSPTDLAHALIGSSRATRAGLVAASWD